MITSYELCMILIERFEFYDEKLQITAPIKLLSMSFSQWQLK